MTNAYRNGKDLYATIASNVYKNTYWDNMEHYEDGTPNPQGKKRRSNCKSLLLGLMYGRGTASVAEQIGSSYDEAQKIVDDFFNSFPKVKEWINKTEEDAKRNGYVEDLWGRRRRLPDIQLPKYTLKSQNNKTEFNPLLDAAGKVDSGNQKKIENFQKELEKVNSRKDFLVIKNRAEQEGISITDNGGFISRAERQCVNARIQGGAASMSKLAMRKVYDNQELRDLGFHILLQIHDELIGECPEENVDKVADLLTSIMKSSAQPVVQVPFKCDATIEPNWYFSDYQDQLIDSYNRLLKDHSEDEAFNEIYQEHQEFTDIQLKEILKL